MSGRLPAQIDPIRLAEEGVRLVGELPGNAFSRLHEGGRTNQTPVKVDLTFERTLHGVRLLRGTLQTVVEATCQRCLEPFQLELTAAPLVALLTPAEAPDGVPDEAESMVIEGPVTLQDLVEDELLLAMPMIPAHAEGRCAVPGTQPDPEVEVKETGAESDRSNPFAVLRGRMDKD